MFSLRSAELNGAAGIRDSFGVTFSVVVSLRYGKENSPSVSLRIPCCRASHRLFVFFFPKGRWLLARHAEFGVLESYSIARMHIPQINLGAEASLG